MKKAKFFIIINISFLLTSCSNNIKDLYEYNKSYDIDKTIQKNNYLDELTSEDYELNEYIDNYKKTPIKDNDGFYISDSIINLIPEEYFYNEGINYYQGKKYGFFIRTTIDKTNKFKFYNELLIYKVNLIYTDLPISFVYYVEPVLDNTYNTYIKNEYISDERWNNLKLPYNEDLFIHNKKKNANLKIKNPSFGMNINLIEDNIPKKDQIFIGTSTYHTESHYNDSIRNLSYKTYSSAINFNEFQENTITFGNNIIKNITNNIEQTKDKILIGECTVNEDRNVATSRYHRMLPDQLSEYGFLTQNFLISPNYDWIEGHILLSANRKDYIRITLNICYDHQFYNRNYNFTVDIYSNFEIVKDNSKENIFNKYEGEIEHIARCNSVITSDIYNFVRD